VKKFCIKLNELLDVQIQIYSALADGNLILVEGCLKILNLITEFFSFVSLICVALASTIDSNRAGLFLRMQ